MLTPLSSVPLLHHIVPTCVVHMHDFYSIIYLSSSAGGGVGGVGACERRSDSLMIAPTIYSKAELIDCCRLSPGAGAPFWRFRDLLFIYAIP